MPLHLFNCPNDTKESIISACRQLTAQDAANIIIDHSNRVVNCPADEYIFLDFVPSDNGEYDLYLDSSCYDDTKPVADVLKILFDIICTPTDSSTYASVQQYFSDRCRVKLPDDILVKACQQGFINSPPPYSPAINNPQELVGSKTAAPTYSAEIRNGEVVSLLAYDFNESQEQRSEPPCYDFS